MVDMTSVPKRPAGGLHTTDDARKRLRRRYAFESRFKWFGILALLVAASALVALLSTVLGKAAGALQESYLVIDVQTDIDAIDPKRTGNPSVIRRGDFEGAVKKALRAEFPDVKKRRAKRELYGIVSDAAALELRQAAMDDPKILGTKRRERLLASDDVQLWIAGDMGEMVSLPSVGKATPIGTSGDVKLTVESNVFAGILAEVKKQLLEKASSFESNAAAQSRGIAFYNRELAAVGDDVDLKKEYQDKIFGYTQRRDSFLEKRDALITRAKAPGGSKFIDSALPSYFVEINGGVIQIKKVSANAIEGPALVALQSEAPAAQSDWTLKTVTTSEASRTVSDRQVVLVERLRAQGRVETQFNWRFFSSGDSREAEIAGVWGAVVGSFWTMMVTFALAFPIGVMAAIYLEEFAPKNRITDFIEVNINNLAAVPSIVFGLLGLSVFLNFFGVPRSAPLAGGMVLALMTLPTIIIAARAAIKAVPPSIREAALGVGASNLQATTHHVLPLAMPGILTGTIIGMAQALGETAPLLMIGMVAFIVDVPTGVLDPATALPVQIFRWSDFPERAFELKTAAAIAVLLGFLVVMNILAVILRKRFERRW